METPRRIIIRTAWCLAKGYWKSAERSSAWSLLVAVIVLNLGNVYIGVRINEWNRAFYNALQTFNAMALLRQVGIFWYPGGVRSVSFGFRAVSQPIASDSLATMVDQEISGYLVG
jgi:ABC-type uncharacterized transport system fused permease/ATPase subunit